MIWMLSLAVKSTLVLGAATAVARALRRSSASTRHTLWCLTLLALVALPVLSVALPRLELPLLSAPLPGAAQHLQTVAAGSAGTRAPLDTATAFPASWWDWALLAWLAGVGLALTQLASGSFLVARAVRRAQPVAPDWNALLAETATTLGLHRRVELRMSPAVYVPYVWGYRSPIVLLPPGAESWPEERRRAILLHELAHVERHDGLTQTLAYVVRALYWPHPLVWWAVSSLRREAECACDDRVLEAGASAPEYARHLLETARGLSRPTSRFVTASTGAEGTRLGDRLLALLDEHRDRRVPTRRATVLLYGAMLFAVAVLAAAQPVAARTPVGSPAQASTDPAPGERIVHEPVGCLVEGRYPEIDATIEQPSGVEEARIYFFAATSEKPIEFWTEMTRNGSRFVGRLPKPRAEASPVRYRIEARRAEGRVTSTERYVVVVAPNESACPQGARIAPLAPSSEAVVLHESTRP